MTEREEAAVAAVCRAVLATSDALEQACEELCELDAVAGDGDHGLAMANAARSIRQTLESRPPRDLAALVGLVAGEFAAMGGSMGALTYILVDAVGKAAPAPGSKLTAHDVARLLATAEDAVGSFGSARQGDKTIVDAIAAARGAADDCASLCASPRETLLKAATAARDGADATAGMVAQVGRASRLGELSRGTADPGATSFAIALSAIAHAYAEDRARA
ncbi:MAG: DAK2 domain-containing protein [Actinobacteria bacterium]|nr:MAG: DAK2 domain-containing protein [Actinomycetota bacterium]